MQNRIIDRIDKVVEIFGHFFFLAKNKKVYYDKMSLAAMHAKGRVK